MKKLFLTLIMIGTAIFVQAQSLSTVKGKTRDGKTVEVKYYHGTISDQIESVQYQVVDELQARINTIQSESKSLQNRLDAANAELRQLRSQVEGGNADAKSLRREIAEKSATIDSLNQQKASLNGELLQLEAQQLELQARYDSLLTVQQSLQDEKQSLEDEKQTLLNEKQSWKDERQSLLAKPKPERKVVVVQAGEQPEKTPVVGLELGMGPAFMGNCVDDSWAKDTQLGGRVAVYYGTPRLSESFPISIEAGLGMRWFAMAAHQDMAFEQIDCTDIDGDAYQASLSAEDLKEQLTLTYLDIPIRLSFGQPAKDHVIAYFKIGVMPSINLLSNFNSSGTYTLKGYYPQWDVTLDDIPELGFGGGDYHENATADISRFNLWGNAAFGVYVPFKGTHLLLNAGMKADYSILSIGMVSVGQYAGTPLREAGLLDAGGRVFIPSIEVGLVYTIK